MAVKSKVIIPTAINVLTAVNAELLTLRRANVSLQVTLPSLRRRALLIVNETGTLTMKPTDTTGGPSNG